MSLIESKCEEEGTKQQKSLFDAMKEYFRNLEENKMKKWFLKTIWIYDSFGLKILIW